ncbi:hypothetical protein M8C21_028593 [Ambrosia artemisiifolia]|uniref:Uncharacterized protein n=1 Tax=Ambrosia artemisiifolia TaxID=4212 RepID=A0AAD5C282_AMBAR|nr:hypothetical protein M8C21_028593 [Ambrosia artemisiifolia]
MGLMCYVRHGVMPSSSVHDYSGNIIDAPLAIQSPKVGRWYILILPLDLSNRTMRNINVCYSLTWQMRQCPQNKAGVNCTWERYMLQTILRKNPALPFESYYIPISDNGSSRSSNFLLEPLLSYNSLNQSQSQSQDFAWTYFVVDIPSDAAGGSIHVQINSDTKLNYEIYVSYGGLPLEDKWDYFYENLTTIVTVIIHMEALTVALNLSLIEDGQREQSIDIHGVLRHILQSVSLIASNVAFVFPAYWALRQKAFAEWVIYTSSGISSGLYHACDVGTWCALSLHVLQFMDFWLSFMAVVSTFVYLATIDETSKRGRFIWWLQSLQHSCQKPELHGMLYGPSNIVLVIAIGATGLLAGWLIEFFTHYRRFSLSAELFLNMHHW